MSLFRKKKSISLLPINKIKIYFFTHYYYQMIVCHIKLSKYQHSSFRNRLSFLKIKKYFSKKIHSYYPILNCYTKHLTCDCICSVFEFIVL